MRLSSIIGLVFSIILYVRAAFVWRSCGYDCGIWPNSGSGSGIAAVGASFLAIFTFVVSLILFGISLIRAKCRKTAGAA
jgi:hypothetical protein